MEMRSVCRPRRFWWKVRGESFFKWPFSCGYLRTGAGFWLFLKWSLYRHAVDSKQSLYSLVHVCIFAEDLQQRLCCLVHVCGCAESRSTDCVILFMCVVEKLPAQDRMAPIPQPVLQCHVTCSSEELLQSLSSSRDEKNQVLGTLHGQHFPWQARPLSYCYSASNWPASSSDLHISRQSAALGRRTS